jgi:hypothetical protein
MAEESWLVNTVALAVVTAARDGSGVGARRLGSRSAGTAVFGEPSGDAGGGDRLVSQTILERFFSGFQSQKSHLGKPARLFRLLLATLFGLSVDRVFGRRCATRWLGAHPATNQSLDFRLF